MKEYKPSNAGPIIAVLFTIASLAQCGRRLPVHTTQAACGGSDSQLRPVTIGGSMVIGCR